MSAWDVGFGGVRSEVAAALKPQRHREGGRPGVAQGGRGHVIGRGWRSRQGSDHTLAKELGHRQPESLEGLR